MMMIWLFSFKADMTTKVQKLPYPLDGPSLSKADNAKTEAEANDMAKIPYRAIVGMLSYIMGHTKPDIAYALNVLSRYCNNPGRRVIWKWCENLTFVLSRRRVV